MFSDCHKIIFSVVPVQLIAMMITGLATRDLAVPASSGGGPVAVVGSTTSATTCGALRLDDVNPGALPAPPLRLSAGRPCDGVTGSGEQPEGLVDG